MSVTAIVVAAGAGKRMGGEVPKQFWRLGAKAVVAHAVDSLAAHPRVDAVRVVIGQGQQEMAQAALEARDVTFIVGGAERHDSVRNGLEGLRDGIVLIHDAARSFCPPGVIDALLDALRDAPAAVPVLPAADTLARGAGKLDEIVDRSGMLRVQTPQAFRVGELLQAFEKTSLTKATDESSIMVQAGFSVAAVPGSAQLEKLTGADDWNRAEAMPGSTLVPCTGQGFDVHAFAGEGPIMMGGIAIPYDRGLAGHSDADVVLHALTDAILGALAEGDIGAHFPPGDAQWKGASSDRFLAHAVALVRERGGSVDHLDCTVICEGPRLGPYRDAMRQRISEISGVPISRVSIKATTTERLGFAGRGEGIAALAIASVRLPR